MTDWDAFNKKTKGLSSRAIVAEAIGYTQGRERALDLGSGAMRDITVIYEAGFKQIDAVDSNQRIESIAQEKIKQGVPLTFFPMPYHEFKFRENAYDFINAQYAIAFAGPEHIERVMTSIKFSTKKGGVFVGTFFGHDDEWAGRPDITVHSRKSVEQFFNDGWVVNKFDEEKSVRPTATGVEKKWHVFHVTATRIR